VPVVAVLRQALTLFRDDFWRDSGQGFDDSVGELVRCVPRFLQQYSVFYTYDYLFTYDII